MLGSAVGPYRIVRRLGVGGMGEVFLGLDPRLERQVALKCLTPESAAFGDARARMLREARAAARLAHPHIAGIYDVLEENGRTFIVMEYVEGTSLAAHLAGGAMPGADVRRLGRQLASALAAAHAHGVVHRDLKPANIQLTADGSIKVLDFGVAKFLTVLSPSDATTGPAGVTDTFGGIPGTPMYMSPEQLTGRPLDARADIFAAGLILFEMATGRRPYPDTNPVALALAMQAGPPATAHATNPLVPLDLSAAIAKALERDLLQRFQTARELEIALTVVESAAVTRSADAASAPTPPAVPRRTARASVWTLVTAAAVVLAAGLTTLSPVRSRLGLAAMASAATRPISIAILPIDNPSGDPQGDYLGAGIASVVAENLASIPGLTVLSRASTAAYANARTDLTPLQKDLGADYVIDVGLRVASPNPRIVARLRRPGVAQAVWEQTLSGDALAVEHGLLDGVSRALEGVALKRRLTPTERQHLQKLPTTSGEALMQYSRARALLDRWDMPGNVDAAIRQLEGALATDPNFALAHAALGDALWTEYQRDHAPAVAQRATAEVLEALRIDPTQAQVHYSLAMMYDRTGQPARALESVRRSIQLQPDSDDSHRLAGMILAASNDVEGAIAEMSEAIRIRPSFWSNHSGLGFALYSAGRYEDALNAYRRAAELQPTDARAVAMIGTMNHLLGRMDQAIGNYEHAVRLGPSRTAYANLGLAYYESRRYAEALEAYKSAAEQEPNYPLTHRNIGDVYVKLGRDADARASYEKAIEIGERMLRINPRDASTISLIATCEAKLGRAAAAERHAAEAVAIAPANREALVRSAQVHARLHQPDAALKDLASAIDRGYDRRQARDEGEFAAIRNLPAFQKMIEGAGAPGKP